MLKLSETFVMVEYRYISGFLSRFVMLCKKMYTEKKKMYKTCKRVRRSLNYFFLCRILVIIFFIFRVLWISGHGNFIPA